jgi:hypothetical protein
LPTAYGSAVTVVGLVVLHRAFEIAIAGQNWTTRTSADVPKEADSENDLR